LAVHKSVEKRARQNIKARSRNRVWKSKIKTAKLGLEQAIENKKTDQLASLYSNYVSAIDKASSRNVIHKNTASRKKKRMAQKIKGTGERT
jgi:small subunit ribosomal protein S20